ncbi:uncharacterized protein LOC121369231 isoform X2 [Gigantopelta aegis]|uniref:uncharacterized protein LOC121369231 isoform X2 n=1 Tax=Gigantopelta aegis TaxID=1735272 RepID=UPI001B8897C7|nr:uncharacterized protein LOC121369231 isoform X2 [Gigantopelta aegis]
MDKAEFWLEPIFLTSNLSVTAGTQSGRDFTSEDLADVGGVLDSDVVMDADKLFVITRTILVPAGITLTINANTTLQFQKNRGIFVKGTLNFEGGMERDVELSNYESGKWKGVLYNYTSSTNPGEDMTIKHVQIMGASTCLRLFVNQTGSTSIRSVGLYCDNALYINLLNQHTLQVANSTTNNRVTVDVKTSKKMVLLLTNVTSKTTSGNSLYVNVASGNIGDINVTMLSSNYSNSNGWVWNFDSYYSYVSLTIDHSSITSNSGIYLNALSPKVDIQVSNVTTNYQAFNIYFRSSTNSKNQNLETIVINKCNIEVKEYQNVLVLATQNSGQKHSLVVNNNYIYGNGYNPMFDIQTYSALWNITFKGNTFTQPKTGWCLNFRGKCEVFNVSQNTFNNTNKAVSVQVQNSPNAKILVQNNTIAGRMEFSSTVDLVTQMLFERNILHNGNIILNTPDILLRENIFENITTTYVISFEKSGYGTQLINASYNFWDTTDVKAIRRMIYDSSYSPDLPTISIIPFYEFRNLSSPIYPISTFLSPDGTIGGSVGGHVVLTAKNSPYRVVSNIVVPKQESLTIEAGVKLLFQKGLKMTVQGKLNVSGTYSSPVQVIPEIPTEKWKGIFLNGHIYLPSSSDSSRIRLINSQTQNETQTEIPSREGRVEILVDGVWGTVCDDGFDNDDAMVVCRMLGFNPRGNIEIQPSAGYGQGTGPIHYGNVECTGGESSIYDCVHPSFSCSHGEDVGIRCPRNRLPSPADILNDVQISNLLINDTTDGITIDGNVTRFVNVTSSHSSKHGMVIHGNQNDTPIYNFIGVRVVDNGKSGIDFMTSDQDRTMNVILHMCNLSANGMYGLHISVPHNVTLSQCLVARNNGGGVYIDSKLKVRFKVLSSIFTQNKDFGVSVYSYSGRRWADVTISNSMFTKHKRKWSRLSNKVIDIDLRYTRHLRISLLSNNFTDNDISVVKLTSSSDDEKSYIVVANNTVNTNQGTVFHITAYNRAGTVIITNNTVNKNQGTVFHITGNRRDGRVIITNNTVVNNTLPSSYPLVVFQNARNVNLSVNIFKTNTAQTLLKVSGDTSNSPNISIAKNVFSDNTVNDVLLTSVYGIVVQNNSFNNPNAKCELNTPVFHRLLSINARYNYWGHGRLEQIVDRICGFDRNMDKCIVDYIPFYESTLQQSLSFSGFQDPVYAGASGGAVPSMSTMQAQKSPFVIKRSLYIGIDKHLMIEEGTELIFERNRGIYVEGQLFAKGSTEEKIRFKAAVNETWNGVVFPFKPSVVSKNIRLVGGNSSNEGRVEIFHNFTWYTVCDDNFGRDEAQIICTDLGYSSRVSEVFSRAQFGEGTGPILYDVGCSSRDIVLTECTASGWSTGRCNHGEDVGLRCGKVLLQDTLRNSLLENVIVSGSRKGLVVNTNTLNISNCYITNTKESGITLLTKVRTFNLNGTVVTSSYLHGITVKVNRYLSIQNGTVSNNTKHGIFISGDEGEVYLTEMTVDGNIEYGIGVETNGGEQQMMTITKSEFLNHQNTALHMKSTNSYYSNTHILIKDNKYTNNTGQSIAINFDNSYYTYRPQTVSILSNSFIQSGAVNIKTRYNASVAVKDNSVMDCNCGSDCFFTLDVYSGSSVNTPHNITISTNSFSRVTGRCVVLLKTDTKKCPGSFQYNHITASKVVESTILVNSPYINMSYNILDNPAADYEVKVLEEGTGVIRAQNNWWGTKDTERVKTRIFDHQQDPRLFTVQFSPILTDQTFDCSQVNNCSGQGECVRPNGCRCQSGWAGRDCTLYDCSDLGNCQSNGQCIGPNLCECSSGWTGTSCVTATCYGVSNCSGPDRGLCILPNKCFCLSQFRGLDCSECAEYHWGPDCYPCQICKHGVCDVNTGVCRCKSKNWAGKLCDECNEAFYGPACLPFTNILNIVPDSVRDTGGSLIHVWGHNFPETDGHIFYCKFGTEVDNGSWLSHEHVTCTSPQHKAGQVLLEVSPDGKEFTRNKTAFSFYAVCPSGSCNRHTTPPQGQCLFGGCLCNLPWSGRDCAVKLLAPVVLPVANQQILEGEEYNLQLKLKQGSLPVRWTLTSHPLGLSVDTSSGLVQWERAVASEDSHTIKVVASNRIGSHVLTWHVMVPLSYNATIDEILPGHSLSFPRAVTIKGHVTFLQSASLLPLVDVKIRNKEKTTMISTYTSHHGLHLFEATYIPKPGESGIFVVDARHPSDGGFSQQATWSVKGMTCSPSYVFKQAYLDTDTVSFTSIAKLINTGVDLLENITAKVVGISGPLKYFVVRIGSRSTGDASIVLVNQLQPGADVIFDIILKASRPLRGTIGIEFTTPTGTVARMHVNIQLNIRRPVFELSPKSLKDSIPRGHQKTFEVNVTNLGEVSATNVKALLPSGSLVSLVSFGRSTGSTTTKGGLSLKPGESALLVITATADSTMELGETSGTIAINSDLATASLRYHFYITSLNTLDLKIRVEDEYTYFASDKPLVSGAEITLLNPRRGIKMVLHTTNQTDDVVFTNITEDQYTLRAKAPGHASYSAVILAKMSQTKMTIFLQRIAVKYTWTVTPTTFEDKYIITLDSTFETRVPMPVVTIEPVEVNLIPYEEGKKTVMEFLLRNHGLIRADNVRFQLPVSHPSLKFTQTIEIIGSLEANTSLVVPIRVEVKTRDKRFAARTVCGLKMLYDYFCGGTRTQSSVVTLHRHYPGRPPLPCEGVNFDGRSRGDLGTYLGVSQSGGRYSPGSSASSTMTYIPVTPLSCNCSKTLIKSCLLAFYPKYIVACGLSIFDFVLASSFKERVFSAIDTAFACVIGVLQTGIGLVYTAVRCLYEINKNCLTSSRHRRDVSSEIVNEVIKSSQALYNYLNIIDEIFGDKKVFDLDATWYNGFKLAIADDSVSGSLLSKSEVSSITSPFNETQRATLHKFLIRWNNTVAAWQNGSLIRLSSDANVIPYNKLNRPFNQYKRDSKKAKDRGYGSIFDYFDNTVQTYNNNERKKKGGDDGVCAKVRVRIVQELVLTRDAFNARLEIENGEDSALEDIRVTINIQATYGDGTAADNLFSIGSPKLSGLTGVDGTGSLGRGVSGSSEWLIIPYSTAAVKDDTLYDVGGRLSYTVAGSNFSVPLLPDTITVKPNPSLIVHYFHDKYVQGDDPMTKNITEPVVPFSLAVMISNGAYGTARQLKITSAQPEIIENEKGLLISFKIIGAQLGNKPVTPSLSINFGDIDSFETKTARWLLTSSLKGKFYNYSATFENINPLGDPQLSVLEKLDYHDLIHLVRIEHPDDDQLDDFLVNDVVDEDELPDALYDSSNGFYSTHVVVSQVVKFQFVKTDTHQSSTYTIVNLSVSVSSDDTDVYGYTRVVNNVTQLPLVQVIRSDGKQILVGKNAWLTSHYHDTNYLHVFDLYRNASARASYQLIFGRGKPYISISKNVTDVTSRTHTNAETSVTSAIQTDGETSVTSATQTDGENIVTSPSNLRPNDTRPAPTTPHLTASATAIKAVVVSVVAITMYSMSLIIIHN